MKSNVRGAILRFGPGVLAVGLAITTASGQNARLLGDLNTSQGGGGGPQDAGLGVGGDTIAYFLFSDVLNLTEVWRTDGTPEGTWPLGDMPYPVTNIYGVAGNSIIFENNTVTAANHGVRGEFEAIMPRSYPIQRPGRLNTTSWLPHASVDDKLYFVAGMFTPSQQSLHVTDGTAAGTHTVWTPDFGLSVSAVAATPSRLFAVGSDSTALPSSLVVMDTDSMGPPTVVRTFFPTQPSGIGWPSWWLTPAGESVAFVAPIAFQRPEVWISDGTEAGTTPLTAQSSPFASYTYLTWNGTRLAFLGPRASGSNFPQLWISDGTPGGTARAEFTNQFISGVPDMVSPQVPSRPIVAINGSFGIVAYPNDGGNPRLYVGDGSLAGTSAIDTVGDYVYTFIGVGRTAGIDIAYFVVRNGLVWQLCRTDGTQQGTFAVPEATSRNYAGDIVPLSMLNGRLVYALDQGKKVFITDGTADGTVALVDRADAMPNGSSSPTRFTSFGDEVVFAANAGSAGVERFRATALAGSAEMCEESTLYANSDMTVMFVTVNGKLFSNVTKHVATKSGIQRVDALVVTENAAALGETVYQTPGSTWIRHLTVMNGVVYFTAPFDETLPNRTTLFRSDGTAKGTYAVAPENETLGNVASPVYEWNGRGYFTAEGETGVELWSTDGTGAGRRRVAVMAGFNANTNPQFLGASTGLYFKLADAAGQPHPWTSNGTPEGTRVLDPDLTMPSHNAAPTMAVVNGRVYISGVRPESVADIWTPNKDATGLEPAITIPNGVSPLWLTSVPTSFGERLFFTVSGSGLGNELWASDGTSEETWMVADLWPGPFSSSPANLTVYGETLLFTAATGLTGREVWRSDGTAEGTRLLTEVNEGPTPSHPSELVVHDGVLYMSAVSEAAGREPFAMRLERCRGDVNEDDVLNSQDFFDFLMCFFEAGCTGADLNADGVVNSQDFFDFLTVFFAGC